MVFNATFKNISAISWRSVLLGEETGGPGENHRPAASHWQTLSHNVVHLALSGIRTHNISCDMHRCKLPHDHGHNGPLDKRSIRVHHIHFVDEYRISDRIKCISVMMFKTNLIKINRYNTLRSLYNPWLNPTRGYNHINFHIRVPIIKKNII